MKNNFFWLALLVVIFLSGCNVQTTGLSGSKNTVAKIDGGVWKSIDSGNVWNQSVAIATTNNKSSSIGNTDIKKIIFDPLDHQALYAVTKSDGVVYTYDAGASWRQFALPVGHFYSFTVSPKNKCQLYTLVDNKIYQSVDCGRTWQNSYFHQEKDVYLSDIAINKSNPSILFLGTSNGNILRSINGGQSWSVLYRIKNAQIVDFIQDPNDNNVIYVATKNSGLYKTLDGGASWRSLGDGLKSYSGSSEYYTLVIDKATPGGLILVSKFGILKSTDGGISWIIIDLVPGSQSTSIETLAVNPQNSKEIYYTTSDSLVKTIDGGVTWSSHKLPFDRSAPCIAIDPVNPKVVYLCAFKK
ncbi:MAG: hypothetical protein WCP18_00735 [bacterium]